MKDKDGQNSSQLQFLSKMKRTVSSSAKLRLRDIPRIFVALSLWIGLLLNEGRFIYENSSIADTGDGILAPSSPSTKTHSHQQQHERQQIIEKALIIATVPYTSEHVLAIWTQLECIASNHDKVVISAPDAPWSRDIIGQIVNEFKIRSESRIGNKTDTAFYVNNRYDAGLWCDGLKHNLGFGLEHEYHFRNSTKPRAVFLTNDSLVALRRYDNLTNEVTTATLSGKAKLVSLNGKVDDLETPNEDLWVESVYRGFTPDALPTFVRHTCGVGVGRQCKRLGAKAKFKRCIVETFETSLASEYQADEVGIMYPSYFPSIWNSSEWVKANGAVDPKDHWLKGGRYFDFLLESEHFPFRKKGIRRELPTQCTSLFTDKELLWFELLPYPSKETLSAHQQAMHASFGEQ